MKAVLVVIALLSSCLSLSLPHNFFVPTFHATLFLPLPVSTNSAPSSFPSFFPSKADAGAASGSPLLARLWNLNGVTNETVIARDDKTPLKPYTLAGTKGKDASVYPYSGSLTTPPCSGEFLLLSPALLL